MSAIAQCRCYLLAEDGVTQRALGLLIGLRELRRDPFYEGSQGVALTAHAREDEMMANIADVCGATSERRDQSPRFYFAFGQAS